jgi:hypothetical protein
MSLKIPMTLEWGERFPLRDVFTNEQPNLAPERMGGIYMWGYDANETEVIWYVGSATKLRARLRQHYLYLMSCQYQIPKGFLNGSFKELADIASGWACDLNNQLIIERLRDWNQMHDIYKGAHEFANQAFSRIAPINGKTESELRAIESAVIYDLQPIINHRHKAAPNHIQVTHVLSAVDSDWLQRWRSVHNVLVKQGVIKSKRSMI